VASTDYRDVRVETSGQGLSIRMSVENRSQKQWRCESFSIGWQVFDPASNRFIREGEWTPLARDTGPGEAAAVDLNIDFPPEAGDYRIYVSPIDTESGWLYDQGERFLMIDAVVENERAAVLRTELTTRRALLRRGLLRAIPRIFAQPFVTMSRHRALIRSMVRRDIMARYRGSFGDLFWTVLNPLLLMLTYYFVFGVVLRTRFGADQSSGSFLLYFLAGMLPWLAFSEPVGRSPNSILEHRTFVKKLVFPLDTLSVNHAMAGLVTEVFALGVFLCFLVVLRGHIPWTVGWLPALLIPQILFTLGVCWFLAALGVFVRDLAQVIGFILTLWFFITPICYPEQSVPAGAVAILSKNPMFVLVRAYRAIFLEGHRPELIPLLVFWMVAVAVFLCGHAWFYKLRKTFADVI
jgi:lipopolysaccharide transport system permease protein